MRTEVRTDQFLDTLAKVVPVLLLTVLGLVAIYTVIGVPLGITLLGLAIGLAVYEFRTTR